MCELEHRKAGAPTHEEPVAEKTGGSRREVQEQAYAKRVDPDTVEQHYPYATPQKVDPISSNTATA